MLCSKSMKNSDMLNNIQKYTLKQLLCIHLSTSFYTYILSGAGKSLPLRIRRSRHPCPCITHYEIHRCIVVIRLVACLQVTLADELTEDKFRSVIRLNTVFIFGFHVT